MQNEKSSHRRKIGYSTDAAILSSLLHSQPLSKEELFAKVLGARPGTDPGTLYHNLRFLTDTGDIKEKDGKYSLFNFSDIKIKIIEACEKRKRKLLVELEYRIYQIWLENLQIVLRNIYISNSQIP